MATEAAKTGLRRFIKGDQVIWAIVIILALISLVAVYSSSNALVYRNNSTHVYQLGKQIMFACMGFVAIFLCYRAPLGFYRNFAYVIYYVSLALILYTQFFGSKTNEAIRWISIFGIKFQPSELAKVSIVIFMAKIFDENSIRSFKEFALKVILPTGILLIALLAGSFSSALFIAIIMLMLMVIFNTKREYILKTLGIGFVAFLLLLAINQFTGKFNRIDTGIARIERFFRKDTDQLSKQERESIEEKLFQETKAKEAIALGGISGVGLGASIYKDILPHAYSDFIFTIIIEETGLWGAGLIILLYLIFLYRCVILANRCNKVFTSAVVIGLGLMITLQAFLHICVNVGLLPVTGHTLPMISLGGSSFLTMCCAFGIILSVSRSIELKEEKLREEAEALAKEQNEQLIPQEYE